MLRLIGLGTLLASMTLMPTASQIAAAQTSSTLSIRFDNGTAPIKTGAVPSKYGESFSLAPGESFIIGGGTSQFSFQSFPKGVEQVTVQLELTPGDRPLMLTLPGGFHLTTDMAQTVVTSVREGAAMMIGYGFDSATPAFASTKVTVIEFKTMEGIR